MSLRRRLRKLEEKLGMIDGQFVVRTPKDARKVRKRIARAMGCEDYEGNLLIAFNRGQGKITKKVHERYAQLKDEGVIVEIEEYDRGQTSSLVDFSEDS